MKNVAGGNPQPRNGKVIGRIVGSVYVPVKEMTPAVEPDMLFYGGAAFVKSVSDDIMVDLLSVYPPKGAITMMGKTS